MTTTTPQPSLVFTVTAKGVEKAKSGRKKAAPRAKLTADMLLGTEGVDGVLGELAGLQFRDEATAEAQEENVRLLLHKYEAWGRKLVPQLGFDEFLASLERLGSRADFRRRLDNLDVGLPFALDRQMAVAADSVAQSSQQQPSAVTVTTTAVVPVAPAASAAIAAAPPSQLTEEQRRLIAERRQRAIELRKQHEPT